MVDDGRTTDGRTTEHGYTISSPCEPDGSGELTSADEMILGKLFNPIVALINPPALAVLNHIN